MQDYKLNAKSRTERARRRADCSCGIHRQHRSTALRLSSRSPRPEKGLYDKLVSIEMLEAVGREYLAMYFDCVNRLLKPEGGIGVFQCITMPETRYEAYSKGEDFIRKYIFPGGHLPTISQLVGSIERGSKGTLVVDSILNIGGHYAKTLRLWGEKFERNFESQIQPALLGEHEGMTQTDVELFKRKWQVSRSLLYAGVYRLLIDVSVLFHILRGGVQY